MVKYVISINVLSDEIAVDVSKDGRYVDEVSFHVTEFEEFSEYMDWLVTAIEREIMGEEVLKVKELQGKKYVGTLTKIANNEALNELRKYGELIPEKKGD